MTDYDLVAKQLIEKSEHLQIATCDYIRYPWISSVAYYIDSNTNLYFISYKNSRHVKHIKINPNVAVTIVNNEIKKGIQLSGIATILENISDEMLELSKKRCPTETLIETEQRKARWIKNNRVIVKIIINKMYINEFDGQVDYRIQLLKPLNLNLSPFKSRL